MTVARQSTSQSSGGAGVYRCFW